IVHSKMGVLKWHIKACGVRGRFYQRLFVLQHFFKYQPLLSGSYGSCVWSCRMPAPMDQRLRIGAHTGEQPSSWQAGLSGVAYRLASLALPRSVVSLSLALVFFLA